MDVTDLISRLEAATEGSRELDALIWVSTLPKSGVALDGIPRLEGWFFEYDAEEDGAVNQYIVKPGEPRHHTGRVKRKSPLFTFSLDSALTLMMPGWILDELGDDAAGQPGAMEIIGATCQISDGAQHEFQFQARTRPLAVCGAVFRARAAL